MEFTELDLPNVNDEESATGSAIAEWAAARQFAEAVAADGSEISLGANALENRAVKRVRVTATPHNASQYTT
eukprot:5336440-Amphidinium_carterae.1